MSPLNSIGRKAVQAFDELGQAPAPRRFFPQEASGSSFPYGSEWWMGYTIEGESTIYIHNVLLHYNRGVIAHTVNPVGFSVGEGVERVLGFSLNFATGGFAQETRADLSGFAQTSDGGDGLFLFPVYKFIGTTMVADYVHGSNLGGL